MAADSLLPDIGSRDFPRDSNQSIDEALVACSEHGNACRFHDLRIYAQDVLATRRLPLDGLLEDSGFYDAFVVTAEKRQFSRSAECPRTDQSALSRTIKELEEDLGARLFAYSTRSTLLARTDKLFLEYVQSVFAALEKGARQRRGCEGRRSGTTARCVVRWCHVDANSRIDMTSQAEQSGLCRLPLRGAAIAADRGDARKPVRRRRQPSNG